MNPEQQQWVNGYLDGTLLDHEEVALNDWIKASTDNAMAFADMVRFHDHLNGVIRSKQKQTVVPSEVSETPKIAVNIHAKRSWRRAGVVSAITALAAVVLLAFWSVNPQHASAATELDRLIEKASEIRDRSYRIRNLDAVAEQSDERRPPIDGAMLHVRQPDQYVLIRNFPDGRVFTTGSDGQRSWSSPPNGAVRVSNDPLRFRGPVPGNQHGIPFVNLRSDLVQLRDAYVVSKLNSDGTNQRGLLAVKKSTDYRGPNRVELWYDSNTGVIQRMVFAGMPKARGGPDSVSVELVEQRDLGNDFFQHKSHHAADQRVIEED